MGSAQMEPNRLNLGCGTTIDPDCVNVDRFPFRGVDVVCDIHLLPFASDSVDEVIASSVLEHLYSPFPALDEIHRVMKTSARLLVRVPALGSRAAHLDPTHRFLNDLKGWREILGEYFEQVKISSEGTRYRDNKVLAAFNLLLVKVCGFHELAQVWTFRCSGKRVPAQRRNTLWWIDEAGAARDVFRLDV